MEQQQPASARPSTSGERPQSQESLVGMFDVHLRFLSDSYLGFFQERKKMEEIYVDSLLKLHKKIRTMDKYLDDNAELNTMRSAWQEVREHCEREAQTRMAFLTSLTADVLTPLAAFKEAQDRTRKRIKEDIKQSSAAYDDYAENTLPKLKRSYLRKCQDVEDYKASIGTSPPNAPVGGTPLSPTESKSSLPSSSPPVVTGPTPLRPIARRPSGSHPVSRNRSPSSGTALSDLAHEGKKQLNQLMGFLEKSKTVKDGLGGRSDAALRNVRAKREADEADKEYRRGIHWLETLRLRRGKILEAGFNSLQLLVHDSSAELKRALTHYTDTLFATSATQNSLAEHLRGVVARISPTADASAVAARIPRSLAMAVPKPTRYWNFAVGECKDLIFGVSLVDYATARALGDNDVPKIVRICINEVDQRGLESEGIYRISGRHAAVQELQRQIERDERSFKFNAQHDDVYIVSSLLKLYLRELPEAVFKFPLQDRIQHSEDFDDHKASNFALLRAKMRRLPPVHFAVLRALVEHLSRVARRSDKNKMDVKNLAIVFGTVIFGEDELPKGGAEQLLAMQSYQDSLMEDLIENAHILFDDRADSPLPAAPAGETAAPVSYGSSHTKVAMSPRSERPPPISPRSERPPPLVGPFGPPSDAPRSAGDFTPSLPARPANSIHPSARALNSPTKKAHEIPPPAPVPVPEPVSSVMPFPAPKSVSSLFSGGPQPQPTLPPRPTELGLNARQPSPPNVAPLTPVSSRPGSSTAPSPSTRRAPSDSALITGDSDDETPKVSDVREPKSAQSADFFSSAPSSPIGGPPEVPANSLTASFPTQPKRTSLDDKPTS